MRYRLLILISIGVSLFSPALSLWGQPIDSNSESPPTTEEKDILLPQSQEQTVPIGETGTGQRTGSWGTLLQMVIVLALCAGAIYGVVFFLKRISRPQERQNPHLKILAGAHLGANRSVHIVSVGTKAWLIGSAEGGVSLISEITDTETVDAMVLESSRKDAETGTAKLPDFARLLSRFTGKDVSEIQPDLNAENVRKRRERLKGL